ncbi:hypothetical protein GCM10027047_39520 [Rhodococcus aerolatus]
MTGVTEVEHRKLGRPHKGDRHMTSVRLPQAVYEEVQRRAAERGAHVSGYLADLVSVTLGLPEYATETRQEQLPMTG